MASCAFCGRDETMVRLFAGGGRGTAAPSELPAVHICIECVGRCAELIGEPPAGAEPEPPSPETETRVLVDWTSFVVDDRPLEWAAARVDLEGTPAVLISVRRPGRGDSGVGVVYPDSTEPSVERARDTARSFWAQLA